VFSIARRTARENLLYSGKGILQEPFGGKTGEKLKCAWQEEEKQGESENAWSEQMLKFS
jgi:hypothetical protein